MLIWRRLILMWLFSNTQINIIDNTLKTYALLYKFLLLNNWFLKATPVIYLKFTNILLFTKTWHFSAVISKFFIFKSNSTACNRINGIDLVILCLVNKILSWKINKSVFHELFEQQYIILPFSEVFIWIRSC